MSHVPSNSDNAEDKETEVKQESSGKNVHEYFILKSVAILTLLAQTKSPNQQNNTEWVKNVSTFWLESFSPHFVTGLT